MNVPVGSLNGPKASGEEYEHALEPFDCGRYARHGDADVVDPEQAGHAGHGR